MKLLIVALLTIISLSATAQNRGWGVDTTDSYDTSRFEAKQGISIYLGAIATEEPGFEFNTTTLFGKGKLKLGFNLSYVYSHFQDTIKANRNDLNTLTPFGAIGFGIVSRLYSGSNQVHLTTSANYMVSTGDNRFRATNGVSLKLALGINLNKHLFVQGGVIAQTYLTTTNERPTNAGFAIGLGLTL